MQTQYLSIYFGHLNRAFCVAAGTKAEMMTRMDRMADGYKSLGMQVDRSLQSAITGHPQITIRGSNQLDDDRFMQLQVSEDGGEF
jgi:hypothetical protein